MKIVLTILSIILGMIILFTIIVVIAKINFNNMITEEIHTMFSEMKSLNAQIVNESDLQNLPEPVQRWLRNSGIVGKPKIYSVYLKQKGHFRTAADKEWFPFEAEEYYTVDPPSFIWKVNMSIAPLVSIDGRDKYTGGKGNMDIRLLSLFQVADGRGAEIDQGSLLRFLNETMWFPSAALSDYIKWEAIDSLNAKATMTYGTISASAVFHFDTAGQVTNMSADRFRALDEGYSIDKWSTPISEYGEFNGIKIPVKGEGVWNLKDVDFSYIRLEITKIEYNLTEIK